MLRRNGSHCQRICQAVLLWELMHKRWKQEVICGLCSSNTASSGELTYTEVGMKECNVQGIHCVCWRSGTDVHKHAWNIWHWEGGWREWYNLGWIHTCNVTAYSNTVSWQCGRDSCPRNLSKVGYSVTLRAFSVCCRYLAVASKGWYGYGGSRCGRATWRCTSTPAQGVTVSSLWCDGQIPTAHRKSP